MDGIKVCVRIARRGFLRRGLGVLVTCGTVGLTAWPLVAQVTEGTPTLKDQLEKGLKARFPQEFAFINTVVTMVESGQLPRDLVLSTFFWVRKNKYQKKYMVPYFERILRARAAEQGITIP